MVSGFREKLKAFDVARLARYLLILGFSLTVMAVLVFSYLFANHAELEKNNVFYLILLCALFVGYSGPIFLYIGAFFWPFGKSWKKKVIVWSLLVFIFISFLPILLFRCDYEWDIAKCRLVFPYEKDFWLMIGNDKKSTYQYGLEWKPYAEVDDVMQFRDVWKEIGKTSFRIQQEKYLNGINGKIFAD